MPTYSEIMSLVRFRSKNAVFKLVTKLVEEGFLFKDRKGKLSPGSFGFARLLGVVEAGFPGAAEEELTDTLSFDEYLIGNKDASFILKVKGDSMIDAGIHEGDIVIVERGREARDGDIVIAEVDGGWTMKYYRKNSGKVFLEPANKKYKAIIPKERLSIAAVVTAVVRKMRT